MTEKVTANKYVGALIKSLWMGAVIGIAALSASTIFMYVLIRKLNLLEQKPAGFDGFAEFIFTIGIRGSIGGAAIGLCVWLIICGYEILTNE